MIEPHRGPGRLLLILLLAASLCGCAKHRAQSAFTEAEELIKAEQYDQAVEKYFAAVESDPANTTYKIKLTAGRTRAAAFHIRKARELAREDRLQEALAEYRLARGFDPSLEVAKVEEQEVQERLRARTLAEEGFTRFQEKRYSAARLLVNEVLRLDPENARGLELQKLLDERSQAVVLDGIELDIASEEPVTLRFQQTSLQEAFKVIGKLSGINFILDADVKGKSISVLLEKGTFAQALELVVQMGGVEKKVLNSKTILIYPNTKDKGKQYQDQVIQTFYLSHIDAKKAINMLRTMLQLRKVYVHEERNALVIRDTPEAIRLAEQMLMAADRADSEVLFDVEVLAVRDGDTLNIGPKLSNYGTKVGFDNVTVGDTQLTVIPDSVIVQSLNNLQTFYTIPSITFDFAKTLSTSEILASPKIRVKNNEKAKIHIGNRDPVVTTTNNANNDQVSQTVQYVDSGIKLDIEPNVQLDGTVLAKITLEVSNAQRLDANDTTGESPVALSTTNAQTSLVLVDGVRTILGGLYENNASKNRTTFPFLGDIPIIGSLLTSFDNSETRREILLSITPYVVKRVEVPEPEVATIWSGGEDTLGVGPKFGAFAKPLVSEVEATKPQAAPGVKAGDGRRSLRGMERQPRGVPGVEENAGAPVAPPPLPAVDNRPDEAAFPPAAAPATAPAAEGLAPTAAVPATPFAVGGELAPRAVPSAELPAAPTPAAQADSSGVAAPGAVLTLPTAPAEGATLGFRRPETVAVGKEFTVEVQVNDIGPLYSAPLFVNYDAERLEFIGASEGTFLGQSGMRTVFSVSPDPTAGQVVVGYKLADQGGGVAGSGVLFTMVFRGKAPGAAALALNRLNFRDASGVLLEVTPATAIIPVQ